MPVATDKIINDQCRSRRHHRKKAMDRTNGAANQRNATSGAVVDVIVITLGTAAVLYTSQMPTPCLSDARAFGRLGTNSWATWPLKPVSAMAFITAG